MPKLDRLTTLILDRIARLRQYEQEILMAMASIEALNNEEDEKARGVVRSGIDLRYKVENAIEHLSLGTQFRSCNTLRDILAKATQFLFSNTVEEIPGIGNGVRDLTRISKALATSAETNKLPRVGRLTYGLPIGEKLVGRAEDMRDLGSHLAAGSPCRVVVICGMGGLGKTSLAAKLCNDLEPEDAAVAFVSLSQNPGLRRIWKEVHDQLSESSVNPHPDIPDQDLEEEVLDILHRKRCIVFLDDIWPQDFEYITKKALTRDTKSGSKLLITTRDAAIQESLDIHVHRLRQLSQSEGAELFQTKLERGQQ